MNLDTQDITSAILEIKKLGIFEVLSKKNTIFVVEKDDNRFHVLITSQDLVLDKEEDILNEIIFLLRAKGFFIVKNLIYVSISYNILAHSTKGGINRLLEVRNTIAVASGKGGVGKSITAVNLALALKSFNLHIGLLDADIYGPSLPTLLGNCERPMLTEEKKIKPLLIDDLEVASIGFIVKKSDPIIYRGPMASYAFIQLFTETAWRDRDFVIIDMPPGTGDVQLTLAKNLPTTASIIVTTSEEVALIDARRAALAFAKMGIPILGLIENMSSYTCVKCGHSEALFGTGGALLLANELRVPFLGAIPFNEKINSELDKGVSLIHQFENSKIAEIYRNIAIKIVNAINSSCGVDYSDKIPPLRLDKA